MIKIFPTIQLKELDAYTIENEPVSSIDLMERASRALARAMSERWSAETPLRYLPDPATMAETRWLFHACWRNGAAG